MTQADQVLQYMKDHGKITTMDAFEKLHITRLSARIWDLRRKGIVISKARQNYVAKDGKAKHYDLYMLGEGL